MKTMFKPVSLALSVALTAAVYLAPTMGSSSGYALAQEAEQKEERKLRRTPALRSKVYEQLARAQKLADEGDVPGALAVLDKVQKKSKSMNSYEKAMMFNFYGFIYYNAEQVPEAIASFEKVVEQQPIPESFEQSTLFSLAQLHMAQGNFDKTIEFVERWEALQVGDIPAKNYMLKAQARYQQKRYDKALVEVEKAIATEEADPDKSGVAPENWYILQRAIYYELKQPEKVTEILVKLVRHFNQPKYWIQLGGMYGELGQEKKQLAVLEAAYQQGFINSGSDMFNLAQLYYYHQAPYKGALIMEQAISEGKLDKSLRNLKFWAQALTFAKENEKALPVMQQAAELSQDGELDAQLAEIHLNLENWDNAIAAGEKALEKGELRSAGRTYANLGLAYFYKGQYVRAIELFSEAEKFKETKAFAQGWSKYAKSEKIEAERREAAASS